MPPLSQHYFTNDDGFLAAVRGAAHTALFALCKLNEIQFKAPWESATPHLRISAF